MSQNSVLLRKAVQSPMPINIVTQLALKEIPHSQLGVLVLRNNEIELIYGSASRRLLICLIFPEISTTTGHYVGLIKRSGNRVFYFDPYGGRRHLSLVKGLIGNRIVQVSNSRYEKRSAKVNTCGAWVIVRLKHSHMCESQFTHLANTDASVVKELIGNWNKQSEKEKGNTEGPISSHTEALVQALTTTSD